MTTGIILLACGSFNPITRMHLGMFQLAKNYFEQNKFKFIKGIISPVHDDYFIKKGKLIKSTVRAEMINLAIDEFNKINKIENSYLMCDQWESNQTKWSRTIDVLNHFKELIKSDFFKSEPKLNKIELKLLCGADLLQSMTNADIWKEEDIKAIINEFGLFVVTRNGFNANQIIQNNDLLKKYSSNIILIENTIGYDDSSTKVRDAFKDGKHPIDLIHRNVYEFIIKNNLYT